MDVAELVLKYVEVVIWPVVALAVAWGLRGYLREAFARMTRIETPAGAIEFEAEARHLRERAEELTRSPSSGLPGRATGEQPYQPQFPVPGPPTVPVPPPAPYSAETPAPVPAPAPPRTPAPAPEHRPWPAPRSEPDDTHAPAPRRAPDAGGDLSPAEEAPAPAADPDPLPPYGPAPDHSSRPAPGHRSPPVPAPESEGPHGSGAGQQPWVADGVYGYGLPPGADGVMPPRLLEGDSLFGASWEVVEVSPVGALVTAWAALAAMLDQALPPLSDTRAGRDTTTLRGRLVLAGSPPELLSVLDGLRRLRDAAVRDGAPVSAQAARHFITGCERVAGGLRRR
ncbi:hypothetical protein QLX52_00970 [Streptomyces albus]|uniref:hypothetical protein n=1 Tax=Streptomyces albus TaxID=1888 RepID=UPI0024ADA7A3|nr:hypothetical protein [Streptomyces albus]MDI6407423.1 hypothetical protein [Streptomyces albus]